MTDEFWMKAALDEADLAALEGEVPVGCVVVATSGEKIASAGNRRERTQDPTAHAEVLAIRDAAKVMGTWRLEGTTLYATLEPCAMCAGAIVNARIARVVWGCHDPKAGAMQSLYEIGLDPRLNHRVIATNGVMAEACAERLSAFFAGLRASGKK